MRKNIIKNKWISVFCILCLSVSNCFTQEKLEKEKVILTIDDAVRYALNNSRTIKSADIDLEMAERASKYSWNVFLPSLNVTGTMARANDFSPSTGDILANAMSGGATPLPSDFENEEARWNVVGGVTASLNLSLAYIQQIRAAKAKYEVGKITFEQSQNETLMNIKKLFYGLLIQQENLKIQKNTLENARQRALQAETNFKNGLVPEIQLLQTQVNYQNTKPTVDSAEQTINQQLDTFAFLIGMPVGTQIELKGSIEPEYVEVDAEELLQKYGNNALSVKSLQANINALKRNLDALNLASYTPALALNYNYQPAYMGDAFGFAGDIGKDDMWFDSGNFSVTLAWNLANMLPFSANRQTARDLKDNIAKLEITMETLKENQKLEVYKAVNNLNQARQQIIAMGRTVTVAQKAYDMSAKSYRNGTTELLDLRDAENSLNQAKLGQLNQKMNYINALMDLENTLNTNLSK
ncbi:MAG: TolC family protein [Treponema sp.]|nr:TolC family protein [Treponema sp.]